MNHRHGTQLARTAQRPSFGVEAPLSAAIMAESSPWPTSDVPLEQRIRSYLDNMENGAFRRVVVEAQAGTVTLTGVAASYYAKQLAQEFTRRIPGVVSVINLIEVAQ
jgi:Predicted periplasmic or secreted lipoprotein